MRNFAAWCFSLLMLAALTVCCQSQTAPAEAQATPSSTPETQITADQADTEINESNTVLHVTTQMVVVDVVVEDKDGHAVTDLRRDDFQLKEDGRNQKLSAFSFQQHDTERPIHARRKQPENVYTNAPSYNPSDALNIIVLDMMNTSLGKQVIMRDALLHLLPTMPKGRPIALYAMTARLRLLHDFTTDPSEIAQAVQNLTPQGILVADNPSGGVGTAASFNSPQVLSAAQSGNGQSRTPQGGFGKNTAPGNDPAMQVSSARYASGQTANLVDYRVQSASSLLKALARALAAYPGRKNVIWISQGFPFSIPPDTRLGVARFDDTHNYAYELAEVADAMMSAQISLYPINAGGLQVFGSLEQIESPHDTMRYLAEQTGGRAFIDTNDIAGSVTQSMEDGSKYYTLSYYSDNKNYEGKYRKIEIDVTRPGVKLHYRPGYFAVDPDAFLKQNDKQRARDFGEAMNFDSPRSTGLLFQATVHPPSPETQNKIEVEFFVDPHAIRYDTGTTGLHEATVECAVQVYDDHGKSVKSQAQRFEVKLKDDIYERTLQSAFPCQQTLENVKPGNYTLRLGVRDDRSGLIGTTRAKLTIEK